MAARRRRGAQELAWLPSPGRVNGSEGYTRGSCLGTRRLRNCIHADYKAKGGTRYKLFVILPQREKTTPMLWRELADHWKRHDHGGLEVISSQLPYRGVVALIRSGSVILGAVGLGDLRSTVALLRKLRRPPGKSH